MGEEAAPTHRFRFAVADHWEKEGRLSMTLLIVRANSISEATNYSQEAVLRSNPGLVRTCGLIEIVDTYDFSPTPTKTED